MADCTNWEYNYTVSLATEADVISMGGPCFDSGWITSGDGEIRTVISCIPGSCTETCPPAAVS